MFVYTNVSYKLTINILVYKRLPLEKIVQNKPIDNICDVGTLMDHWCCQHLDEEPVIECFNDYILSC